MKIVNLFFALAATEDAMYAFLGSEDFPPILLFVQSWFIDFDQLIGRPCLLPLGKSLFTDLSLLRLLSPLPIADEYGILYYNGLPHLPHDLMCGGRLVNVDASISYDEIRRQARCVLAS